MSCRTVMHNAKHSSLTGQAFLVLRIHAVRSESHTSKRVFRSTKTRDKNRRLKSAARGTRPRCSPAMAKLSADAAREVITRGVSDVYTAANLESLESATVRKWCEKWLETKSIEAEESTHARTSG